MPDMHVAVMARAPIPGKCKTRLAQGIGDARAAAWYTAMMHDTLKATEGLADTRTLWVTPESKAYFEGDEHYTRWRVAPQPTAPGLQARLTHVLEAVTADGSGMLVLGTDAPCLGPEGLQMAHEALAAGEAFLWPTEDGGYAALGLPSAQARVFENIAWSTSVVAEQTRARLREVGLSWREAEPTFDVDTVDDLMRLWNMFERGATHPEACHQQWAAERR